MKDDPRVESILEKTDKTAQQDRNIERDKEIRKEKEQVQNRKDS